VVCEELRDVGGWYGHVGVVRLVALHEDGVDIRLNQLWQQGVQGRRAHAYLGVDPLLVTDRF